MAQLMQVRQVARALGVHENTVRRWEERGLLRAVRLPSGVRRFRPEDVEAVRKQMFSGFAPLHADNDVVSVRAHSVQLTQTTSAARTRLPGPAHKARKR